MSSSQTLQQALAGSQPGSIGKPNTNAEIGSNSQQSSDGGNSNPFADALKNSAANNPEKPLDSEGEKLKQLKEWSSRKKELDDKLTAVYTTAKHEEEKQILKIREEIRSLAPQASPNDKVRVMSATSVSAEVVTREGSKGKISYLKSLNKFFRESMEINKSKVWNNHHNSAKNNKNNPFAKTKQTHDDMHHEKNAHMGA